MTSTLYHDEKAYADMVFSISNVIQRQVIGKSEGLQIFWVDD